MLQTQKLKNKDYEIKLPKGGPFNINTDSDFINMHAVILAIAKRNSGKTCSFSNLLRLMKQNNALDRLILVSPTYHNNAHYFKDLPLVNEDILEPTIDAPQKIEEILDTEAQEYEEYHEKLKRWKRLNKMLKDKTKSVHDIPNELLIEFEDTMYNPPQHKYNGKKPVIVVLFDDVQGNDIMLPRAKLNQLVTTHRHKGKLKNSALGVSLLFACQNYTSNQMGLNKSIRGNLTHLLVFKNKNIKELEKIAEECSGEINTETFFKVYNEAIKEPHDFLFIDLHKKATHPSGFRRNFNEFIIPNTLE